MTGVPMLYRPASVQRLLVIVLSLMVLSFVLVLVGAKGALDRLAIRSWQAVVETVRIVESGRMLMEEVTEIERSARQFQSLGDPSLYEVYLKQRELLKGSIELLAHRDLHPLQRTKLNRLVAEEHRLYETLRKARSSPAVVRQAFARFASLGELARSVVSGSGKTIGLEAEHIRERAAHVQHLLFWQAAAVIPVVLVIAVVGARLIAEPLRALEEAVHRLGEGEWSARIEITGPRDLERLGGRLEWLRLRLVELDGQKVKFLRHVSHELKTPLAALCEGSELLQDHSVGALTAAQSEIAQNLCRSSRELQRQIEGLLNFSAIAQTPGLCLNRRPIRLDLLVEKAVSDQRVALQVKRLRVEKALDPAVVCGDRERLRVVLDNLLSNAIKYSPHGGCISVALRPRGGQAVLAVQDQGPGIAPDERDSVFHPFFQGRAVPSGHIKGTGLGLAIAREFVKAHEGSIEVANADSGARLQVTLPLEEKPAEA
jgi:two-component system sensor histidine kinase GlrK